MSIPHQFANKSLNYFLAEPQGDSVDKIINNIITFSEFGAGSHTNIFTL